MIVDNQSNMRRELIENGKIVAWVSARFCGYTNSHWYSHWDNYQVLQPLAGESWGFYEGLA